ncbi:hypothetical protein ACJX0J_039396, partial [Zea mays]
SRWVEVHSVSRMGQDDGRRRHRWHHGPCSGPPGRGGVRGAAGTRHEGGRGRTLRQRGEREGHQRRQLPDLRRGRRGQCQTVRDARP